MEDQLEARVTVIVADGKRGPYALPAGDVVSAGRGDGYGLHFLESWVPTRLCRFLPNDLGWVVQVGPRARMRVQNRYVGSHVFDRRSVVALQEGRTLLRFPELDDDLQLGVVVGPGAGVSAGVPELRDRDVEEHPIRGTSYAAAHVTMTPQQRALVATAFRHLILGGPKPANITAEAAARYGCSEQAVKNALTKVREKINVQRWGPKLESWDQVGHYLVHLTRNVSQGDLPEHMRV